MGWKIKQRQDVEPLCPMTSCLCFDLRMGAFLSASITTFFTFFAWILVVLDMAAWVTPSFEIEGSYFTWWRSQFWKGFYTVDIMMILIHPIILFISIFVIVAILNPGQYKIYHLHPLLKAWYILMILYTICEVGVSVYIYSFYGLAAWRLPYLIFCHMYYIIRFVFSILFIFVVYSYGKEIEAELTMTVHGTGSESTDYLYQPAGARVRQDFGDSRPDFEADVVKYHEAARTSPEAQEEPPHSSYPSRIIPEDQQPNEYPQQEYPRQVIPQTSRPSDYPRQVIPQTSRPNYYQQQVNPQMAQPNYYQQQVNPQMAQPNYYQQQANPQIAQPNDQPRQVYANLGQPQNYELQYMGASHI